MTVELAAEAATLAVELKMLDEASKHPPTLSREMPAPTCAPRSTSAWNQASALVPIGVAIALPEGYAAFIHPRSGLAAKHGITVVNAPGTIDAGYRGEIRVCLLNTDKDKVMDFKRGDPIAQFVIQRIEIASFQLVAALSDSERGTGGFGSTGGFNVP